MGAEGARFGARALAWSEARAQVEFRELLREAQVLRERVKDWELELEPGQFVVERICALPGRSPAQCSVRWLSFGAEHDSTEPLHPLKRLPAYAEFRTLSQLYTKFRHHVDRVVTNDYTNFLALAPAETRRMVAHAYSGDTGDFWRGVPVSLADQVVWDLYAAHPVPPVPAAAAPLAPAPAAAPPAAPAAAPPADEDDDHVSATSGASESPLVVPGTPPPTAAAAAPPPAPRKRKPDADAQPHVRRRLLHSRTVVSVIVEPVAAAAAAAPESPEFPSRFAPLPPPLLVLARAATAAPKPPPDYTQTVRLEPALLSELTDAIARRRQARAGAAAADSAAPLLDTLLRWLTPLAVDTAQPPAVLSHFAHNALLVAWHRVVRFFDASYADYVCHSTLHRIFAHINQQLA